MGLLDMTPQQYGLLAAGLGMMQNSRGKSLGEALGAGGMQGINAITEMQQQQQLQQLKDLQMQKYQEDLQREHAQQGREDKFRANLPNIDATDNNALSKALLDAGLYEDAIKLKKGNGFGNGDYQFISGPNGRVMVGDKNAGSLKWGSIDGQDAVMGVYDPATKAAVKRAEQANTIGDYQDAEGRTAPYWKGGVVRNAPVIPMTPEQEKQKIAELNASDPSAMSAAEYARQTGGIGQSTADKTTQTETAKNDADLAMIKAKNAQSARKLLDMMNMRFRNGSPASDGMGATIDSLIDSATGSGIGNIRDNAYNFFGATSPGALSASQLDAIHGWLTSNVPRMEGPQSNFDVENYKTMAGKVGDRNVPADQKKAALNAIRDMLSEVAKQAGGAAIPGAHAGQKSASGWKVERAD